MHRNVARGSSKRCLFGRSPEQLVEQRAVVDDGLAQLLGVSFAVGAALCRTVFLLVARTELQNTDPRLTTWYSLLSSTALFALGVVATMHWQTPQTAYGWFAVAVVSVLRQSPLLAGYKLIPLSGAQLVNTDETLAISGSPGDIQQRRRIEIRLRKSSSAEATGSVPATAAAAVPH